MNLEKLKEIEKEPASKEWFKKHGNPQLKYNKERLAKKMKPIGEEMHHTFKKLGHAVGKFKKYKHNKGDKLPF